MNGRWRRRGAAVLAAAAIAAFVATTAAEGAAFGFRVGRSDINGDIFEGSGDIGGVGLFGLQAVFPVLPLVSVSIAGESRSEELTFDSNLPGQVVSGDAEWRDIALYGSGRVRILGFGVGPAGAYAGGGIGVHFTDVDVNGLVGGDEEAREDFLDAVEESSTDFSYHGLLGVSFGVPVLPLSAFAELRFEDITGDFNPSGYSAYAGINLELP